MYDIYVIQTVKGLLKIEFLLFVSLCLWEMKLSMIPNFRYEEYVNYNFW